MHENTQFINHQRLLISTVVSLARYVYLTCGTIELFQKKIGFQNPNKHVLSEYNICLINKYMFDNHAYIG